jgi:hypothetical protein
VKSLKALIASPAFLVTVVAWGVALLWISGLHEVKGNRVVHTDSVWAYVVVPTFLLLPRTFALFPVYLITSAFAWGLAVAWCWQRFRRWLQSRRR